MFILEEMVNSRVSRPWFDDAEMILGLSKKSEERRVYDLTQRAPESL